MKESRSNLTREKGQAIIIIAFVFVGLLAAVGLVVDLGLVLAGQVQLRRAVDSAALAGAAQFRLTASNSEAAVYNNVVHAAKDTLRAHNIPAITIDTNTQVDTGYSDASMLTNPPTKKVRVRISHDVQLTFLRLVGWESVLVEVESVTEAAAVDVALVLDISDSMANGGCTGGDYLCAYNCDLVPDCEPFQTVKSSALAFLDFLAPNFDRVAVIPFAREIGLTPGVDFVELTTDLNSARTFITALKLGIPEWAGAPPPFPPPSPPLYEAPDWDPRLFTNTNIGGGVRAGTFELLKEFIGNPNHPAKERLRVIILLTDGAANASGVGAEGPDYGTPFQLGYCPESTWYDPPSLSNGPFCRAASPGLTLATGRHISTSAEYDAIDYALDWADFAMLDEPVGNGIVMFTIGLGPLVVNTSRGQPDIGEQLLRYMAAGGDDADLNTDLCSGIPSEVSCGNYYFAPNATELLSIFKQIAGRIFTRINQ